MVKSFIFFIMFAQSSFMIRSAVLTSFQEKSRIGQGFIDRVSVVFFTSCWPAAGVALYPWVARFSLVGLIGLDCGISAVTTFVTF
jgi:hypothetical protein